MLTKISNIFKRLLKLFFPMFVAEERKTNISRAQLAKELEPGLNALFGAEYLKYDPDLTPEEKEKLLAEHKQREKKREADKKLVAKKRAAKTKAAKKKTTRVVTAKAKLKPAAAPKKKRGRPPKAKK